MRHRVVALCIALLLSLGLASESWAQSTGTPTAQPGNLAGVLYASSFGQWVVPQSPNGPGSYSWPSPQYCTISANGFTLAPVFKVGTPIYIKDIVPANSEIVTPTAVTLNGAGCSITISPVNQHYSYTITSATGGLQEALNYAAGLPYNIALTADWTRLGGQTAMITAALGTTNQGILDERTACTVAYQWSGSAYTQTANFCSSGIPGSTVQVNGTPVSPNTVANFVNNSSVTFSIASGNQITATAAGGGGGVQPGVEQYRLAQYPEVPTAAIVGPNAALLSDSLGDFLNPQNMALGACTSATPVTGFPNANCHLYTYESIGPNGLLNGTVGHSLTHSQYETTPDTSSGFGTTWFGLTNAYVAGLGGVYTDDPNVGGQKSNYIANQQNCTWDTMASYDCMFQYSFGFGGGDNVGLYQQVFNYADFAGLGEETGVGVDVNLQQGYSNSNPGTGGLWEGTIGTISGTTVNYTPNTGEGGCVTADCDAGAGRFIRDLTSKYNTGTYTINPSTDCSTTVGDQYRCTITGVGTTWTSIPGFVGTHTTYRSGSHYSPMVSNNLCMAINPGTNGNGSNDGDDFTIPIVTGVDDTHLTTYIYPNGGWPPPLSNTGTYAIYSCAWPLQIDKNNHYFTTNDTTGMHTGDLMDQTIGYSTDVSNTGLEINMARHIGLTGYGQALTINNYSDSTAPSMGTAMSINGQWFSDLIHTASADYIIDSYVDPIGSVIRFNSQSATQYPIIQYGDSSHDFYNAMNINQNAASTIPGISFFNNGLAITPANAVVMQNGPCQMDGVGDFNCNYATSSIGGGLGWGQNELVDSQYQAFSSYWVTGCGATDTPNTTDVTDPYGTNTALKIVSSATQQCLPSDASYGNWHQNNITVVAGHQYALYVMMKSNVAGVQVQPNISGAGGDFSQAALLQLTTTWEIYAKTGVASASGSKAVTMAVYTSSANVYVGPTWLCDLTNPGCIYVKTTTAAVSPEIGLFIEGVLQSNTSVTSINGAYGPFTFSFSSGAGSCSGTTCTFTGSSSGGGSVTNFIASSGSWPTWLVPSVATSTTTPTLSVSASAIPNSALASATATVNGQNCTLGSTCTVTVSAVSGVTVSGTPSSTQALVATGSTAADWQAIANSISNSDGTLTISPTTGTVVASIALGHANTWSALQTFSSGISASTVTVSGLASSGTQCVQVNSSGVMSGTGSACGSGGGGAVNSVSNSDGTLTISPTTGTVVASLNTSHSTSYTGTLTLGSTSGTILSEIAAPSGTPGTAEWLWGDSTKHRIGFKFNGTATAFYLSGTSGSATAGDCIEFGTNSIDLVDSGSPCGSGGGGSGTVGNGTQYQLARYAGAGTTTTVTGDTTLSDNGTTLAYTGTSGITATQIALSGTPKLITQTASNTDVNGELTFSSATTASYTFANTYTSHPECTAEPQFDIGSGNRHWISYTGTTSFTINFGSSVSGTVSYQCIGRN